MITNPSMPGIGNVLHCWLDMYKEEHRDLLECDPEFARWLEESYIPIAGGWEF